LADQMVAKTAAHSVGALGNSMDTPTA